MKKIFIALLTLIITVLICLLSVSFCIKDIIVDTLSKEVVSLEIKEKVTSEIKKEYTDARHNVYAYCLRENNTARYSDDGEPSQTAGLPIMDLIKKLGITDVAVVVTRYFGGILLGTGGLVHAYTKAAKEGIIASEPVKMILCRELLIRCDYTFLGKIQSLLSEKGFLFSDPEYSDKVTIKAFVPEENAESFKSYIIDLCSGRADLTFKDTKYLPICTKIL